MSHMWLHIYQKRNTSCMNMFYKYSL